MTLLNKTLLACVLMSAGGLAHAENIEDLSGWKSDGDGAWVYNAYTNIWDQNVNTAAGSFLYQPIDILPHLASLISVGDSHYLGAR